MVHMSGEERGTLVLSGTYAKYPTIHYTFYPPQLQGSTITSQSFLQAFSSNIKQRVFTPSWAKTEVER